MQVPELMHLFIQIVFYMNLVLCVCAVVAVVVILSVLYRNYLFPFSFSLVQVQGGSYRPRF